MLLLWAFHLMHAHYKHTLFAAAVFNWLSKLQLLFLLLLGKWGGEGGGHGCVCICHLKVFAVMLLQHLAAGLGSVWPVGAGLLPAASAGSVHQAYGAGRRGGGCAGGSCPLQHQQHVHWAGLPGE